MGTAYGEGDIGRAAIPFTFAAIVLCLANGVVRGIAPAARVDVCGDVSEYVLLETGLWGAVALCGVLIVLTDCGCCCFGTGRRGGGKKDERSVLAPAEFGIGVVGGDQSRATAAGAPASASGGGGGGGGGGDAGGRSSSGSGSSNDGSASGSGSGDRGGGLANTSACGRLVAQSTWYLGVLCLVVHVVVTFAAIAWLSGHSGTECARATDNNPEAGGSRADDLAIWRMAVSDVVLVMVFIALPAFGYFVTQAWKSLRRDLTGQRG